MSVVPTLRTFVSAYRVVNIVDGLRGRVVSVLLTPQTSRYASPLATSRSVSNTDSLNDPSPRSLQATASPERDCHIQGWTARERYPIKRTMRRKSPRSRSNASVMVSPNRVVSTVQTRAGQGGGCSRWGQWPSRSRRLGARPASRYRARLKQLPPRCVADTKRKMTVRSGWRRDRS